MFIVGINQNTFAVPSVKMLGANNASMVAGKTTTTKQISEKPKSATVAKVAKTPTKAVSKPGINRDGAIPVMKGLNTISKPHWWEYARISRKENKQEFSDLMQQVKESKEKWL